MRGKRALLLKAGISAIILAALFYLVDWQQASTAISNAHFGWAIVACLLAVGVLLLDGLRTSWALSSDKLQLRDHLRIAFEGASVAQLGIGAVAGDIFRTARYAVGTETITRSASHILALRLVGLVVVGLVALTIALWLVISRGFLAGSFERGLAEATFLIFGLALLSIILFKAVWNSKNPRVKNGVKAIKEAASGMTARVWFVSFLMVLFRGMAFACALFALGAFLPVHIPILASTIATLTTIFPFALGGLGIREGALAGIIVLFDAPFISAFSAAILLRVATVIAALAGLLVATLFADRKTPVPTGHSGNKQ